MKNGNCILAPMVNEKGKNETAIHCSETFKRDGTRFVPEISACYSLTTFEGEVLYVGLLKNLRRRMEEPLEEETKIGLTPFGRAVRFFWLEHGEREKMNGPG